MSGCMSDGIQDAQIALQARHFQLAGFLDDFLQLLTRCLMAKHSGVDHTPGGHTCRHAFLESLSIIPTADQGGQPGQKLAHIHTSSVIIGQPLQENSERKT